jgi:arginase family enzyme
VDGPVTGRPLVVNLRARTSDRIAASGEGAEAMARELGALAGVPARVVGEPGTPHEGDWRDDLAASEPVLREANAVVRTGERPVLTASDCSICMATLPALDEDVAIVWLDAHPDFNTPETTPSRFLGGMCLSAACGVWDAGLAYGTIDPARVVMCGVRDVDASEQPLLATRGVGRVERVSQLAPLLEARRVFVHADMDVLDPAVLPGAAFPVPGGLSDDGLRALLAELAASAAEVVGFEVTAFGAPDRAAHFARVLEPLL